MNQRPQSKTICKNDRKSYLQRYTLTRMGSFNSTPKINNVDSQDDNIVVPQGLTYTDLVRHCKLMRGIERPELLTRSFYRPCALFNQDLTDSIRNFHLNSNFNQELTSPNSIRILQWNILSQSLGQGSDGFVMCPDEALSWENRKFLIVQEIVQNNPDIVCLQEVDHFKFLQRILETQDYEGFFFPKPDSPCLYINDNNGPDGCAVFYKKNKFDLINCDSRILEVWRVQTNQVTIAANLRVRESGKEICICTTHLKARNGALMSKLRNEQGKDLLNFISDFAEGRPLIMCGDFNAEPIEPIYHTVLSYPELGLSSAYSDLLKRENNNIEEPYQTESKNSPKLEINGCNKDTDINDVVEQSAANEPPYTTWKVREDGEVCHTIDYVFYTKDKLEANNCLMFPDANEIGDNRTPSFRYPSDHFSLICDFQFRD